MAYKLMVCSKCSNMFRVDARKAPEEGVKCPECGDSDVVGVYEYWKTASSSSAGFGQKKALG